MYFHSTLLVCPPVTSLLLPYYYILYDPIKMTELEFSIFSHYSQEVLLKCTISKCKRHLFFSNMTFIHPHGSYSCDGGLTAV